MKWLGQHIFQLISRFRSDVYLEDVDSGTIVSGGNLGLDSNNKIVKNTVSGGDSSSLKITVKNDTASTINKGRAVHITGEDAKGNTTVVLANYNAAATMPAAGVANESIAAGATGEIITMGEISGVNTTGFSEGDEVWVAANGLYTTTRPTGESLLVQKLAIITHVDASNGAGIVMGAGRANDVPNLDEDAIFLGNSSNQAVATDLSSVGLSKFNNDLKQIAITTHTFNIGAAGSSIQNYFIPYIQQTEAATPNNQHRMVAPYAGSIKKIILHSKAAFASNAKMQLHKIADTTIDDFVNSPNDEDVVADVTADASNRYNAVTFDFSGESGNSFAAGDQLAISFVRNNTATGDCVVTIVYEYTIS